VTKAGPRDQSRTTWPKPDHVTKAGPRDQSRTTWPKPDHVAKAGPNEAEAVLLVVDATLRGRTGDASAVYGRCFIRHSPSQKIGSIRVSPMGSIRVGPSPSTGSVRVCLTQSGAELCALWSTEHTRLSLTCSAVLSYALCGWLMTWIGLPCFSAVGMLHHNCLPPRRHTTRYPNRGNLESSLAALPQEQAPLPGQACSADCQQASSALIPNGRCAPKGAASQGCPNAAPSNQHALCSPSLVPP
jgi:hypothetical protein